MLLSSRVVYREAGSFARVTKCFVKLEFPEVFGKYTKNINCVYRQRAKVLLYYIMITFFPRREAENE